MGKLIELKPAPKAEPIERTLWICNCECLTFYVYGDGRVVCAQCKVEQKFPRWFRFAER